MKPVAVLLAFLVVLWGAAVAAHPSSDERIDILTRRIAAAKHDPRPLVARGAVYSEEGHYDLALADFERAESLGGPLVAAYERAVLHRRKGEFAFACKRLDALLEVAPNHVPALQERARVLGELGDVEAASAAYARLFEVQPRPNPGAYVSAARLLASVENGGVDRALEVLDDGIDRLGMVPQLQQYAIELELERGAEAKALVRLQELGPALGEGVEWQVDMAELLQRLERYDEARGMLSGASAELAQLRSTPARLALKERILGLKARLPLTQGSAAAAEAGDSSR